MKLSPAERETIILFSDADDTASVYTYDRRPDQASLAPAAACGSTPRPHD